jgi:putative FmdB family regulatory protein
MSRLLITLLMPTYEYRCKNGHEFTTMQKITDEKLKKCKEKNCDAEVERLISQCSFILKGGGWTPKSSI